MNASSVGKLGQLVTASRLILYHEGRIDPMKDECCQECFKNSTLFAQFSYLS